MKTGVNRRRSAQAHRGIVIAVNDGRMAERNGATDEVRETIHASDAWTFFWRSLKSFKDHWLGAKRTQHQILRNSTRRFFALLASLSLAPTGLVSP